MGLFALGTSVLPVTDRMLREAGNNEGAAISSKAYVVAGIYSGNYNLEAAGTIISASGGVGLAVGLLCGIQAAAVLVLGA